MPRQSPCVEMTALSRSMHKEHRSRHDHRHRQVLNGNPIRANNGITPGRGARSRPARDRRRSAGSSPFGKPDRDEPSTEALKHPTAPALYPAKWSESRCRFPQPTGHSGQCFSGQMASPADRWATEKQRPVLGYLPDSVGGRRRTEWCQHLQKTRSAERPCRPG